MTRLRYWVGQAQFPDKKPFILGSVHAESELEAERLLFDLWKELMPYDPPRTFTVIPGILILQRDDAESL